MKEPKRLFESGSPLERTILGFGRDEAPPPDVVKKTLAAMAATPIASAAPNPPPSRWIRPAAIAGIAAIGLGALLTVVVTRRADPAPVPPPPVRSGVVAPQEHRSEAEPAPQPESVVTPDSLPNAPAPSPAVSHLGVSAAAYAPPKIESASASIAREVELLDGVKAKLAAGDPASAGLRLDTYDSEFPRGTLRPEATVLRVRTLLARRERAAAEKVGGEFLATHPSGVHAKRIRTLLGQENESEK